MLGKPKTAPRQGKKSQVPLPGFESTAIRFGGSYTITSASPLTNKVYYEDMNLQNVRMQAA
jgi:hypothetical protein